MKPKSIHNEDILDNFADEYMYLSCVVFVKKVKKGVFAEHSPLLDDISGVPNWGKVNSGLLKMYRAEVLEKVPIMQHFLFGWLIRWYLVFSLFTLPFRLCYIVDAVIHLMLSVLFLCINDSSKISFGNDRYNETETELRIGVRALY